MIRRIRELAVSLHDDPSADSMGHSASAESIEEEYEDPGLDVLVKNAVRSNWLEHDPRHVWKQLSERVRGPFGQMAVEEPALAGQPMPLAFDSPEEVGTTPEMARHRF